MMTLWRAGDRLALVIGFTLGTSALIVAWIGASGEATTSRQLVWVAIGAAGIIGSGLANAVWLLRGRRAVGQRRNAGVLEPALALLRERHGRFVPAVSGLVEPGLVVAAPSMTRYHRADCILVAGKAVEPGTVTEHAGAGRTACGVCAP